VKLYNINRSGPVFLRQCNDHVHFTTVRRTVDPNPQKN